MVKLNKTQAARTHEGAKGRAFTPEAQLRRALMNSMLWENQFYEDGVAIAERMAALVPKVKAETVAALAIEAREDMKLRHAPLLIVREIYTFSDNVKKIAPRRGFALRDAITSSQPHNGTWLGKAVAQVDRKDARLIVFTDEQSHDPAPAPKGVGYMVNVASYQHGVGHGDWRRVDGFSEKILDWIIASEAAE